MSTSILVNHLPVVFLSLDEDNAEQNYQKLVDAVPTLTRVRGVYGADAAHKMASDKAMALNPSVKHFVTVDADTVADPTFWSLPLEEILNHGSHPDHSVYSFRSFNVVNGCCYGNGGLKIWSHNFVRSMKTHEATDGKVLDFCWDERYHQFKNVFSTTHPNGSPLQAYRSGYREGVKLCLKQGQVIENFRNIDQLWPTCKSRLLQWITVGAHAEHGWWSMLGAREGLLDMLAGKNPAELLTNYRALARHFHLAYGSTTTREVEALMLGAMFERLHDHGLTVPKSFGPKSSQLVWDWLSATVELTRSLELER